MPPCLPALLPSRLPAAYSMPENAESVKLLRVTIREDFSLQMADMVGGWAGGSVGGWVGGLDGCWGLDWVGGCIAGLMDGICEQPLPSSPWHPAFCPAVCSLRPRLTPSTRHAPCLSCSWSRTSRTP